MVTSSPESSALFGKTRQAVLALLFTHTDKSFYLREIVRLVGQGIGPVQRDLKILSDAGILTRRKEGHQVYFQANSASPVFPEIKSLVIKTIGIADVLRSALAPLVDRIDLVFIYGSFAKGGEKGASDVDVMVIGEVGTREVVAAFRDAQKLLGREINPSIYALGEFRDKLRAGHHFVKRVVSGQIIMLYGDESGTKNLGRKRMD